MNATRCLDRRFRPIAEHILRLLRKFGGAQYKITSGCRSHAEQARLYQAYLEGKSAFPVAPPGHSAHEKGLAVDIAGDGNPYQDLLLHAVGASFREAGGVWGESDPIHFELRVGRN